jgi:large subunit ribosomal protein L25
MSQKFVLIAEDRPDQGKGASRRLRRTGKVPAILYGGHRDPRAIALDHNALLHNLENESFFSSILTLTVGDKSQPCILKDVQRHAYRNLILHVDLQRIVEDEEIRVAVPFHFLGEDKAPGIKAGGVISRVMNELEITCLPKDLPSYIEVDVSTLELDDMVALSAVKLPEGVQVVGGEEMLDQPVVAIYRPRREEVESEEGEEGAQESMEAGPGQD